MQLNIKRITDILLYFLLFYIFVGPSPFVVEGVAENSNIQGGQDLFRQLFLLFSLAAFFVLYKFPKRFSDYLCFYLFVGYAALSVFWSDFPEHSFRRVVLLFVIVTICAYIVYSQGELVFKKIFNVLFVIQLANILYLVIFPGLSFTELGFKGIHVQKNTLGVVCVLSIFMSLICYKKIEKWQFFFINLISVVFLVISESKTNLSLLVLLMLILLIGTLFFNFSKNIVVGIFAVFILIFITAGLFPYFFISNYAHLIDHEMLTGRGTIWLVLIDNIEDRPFFGFGYGGFWGVGEKSAVFLSEATWLDKIGEGHNGFLDLLVNLGVVGLYIYLLILILSISRFCYRNTTKEKLPILTMYLYLFLHNFTESSLVNVVQMVWVLFIITSLFFLTRENVS